MKRYVSLDFLRGFAIFNMIILHIISSILDAEALLNNIDSVPLINMVALVILPYFGGLAGFFLLISSTANMVSMQKNLEKGVSTKNLAIKQILGGIILLFFAFLTEAIIGNNGVFGSIMQNLDQPSDIGWEKALYNFNNFETIHTIAWCIIINGAIHMGLSKNNGWKDTMKLVKIYAVLAILVFFLTQPVWNLADWLVEGYPYGKDRFGYELYKPRLGENTAWEVFRSFFLAALAAPMEPLFPYLAISFIGSIIGVFISLPKEKIPKDLPKKMILSGFIIFLVGTVGVVMVLLNVIDSQGFETGAMLYQKIAFHRMWAPDYPDIVIPAFAWIWQFLSLNGFGLMAVMLVFRLVEWRGKAKDFAEKTAFMRRFGFIAFTLYAIQWIYKLVWGLYTTVFLGDPYRKVGWWSAVAIIVISLLTIHGLMLLWERSNYIGSLEWAIGTLAFSLLPVKKKGAMESNKQQPWYMRGALDVKNAFYNPEWLNVIPPNEQDHESGSDASVAYKLSLAGLLMPLFMPLGIIAFFILRNAPEIEHKTKIYKKAKIISGIEFAIVVIFFIICYVLDLSALGLSL